MTPLPFSVQYWSDSGRLQREGHFDPTAIDDTDPLLVVRTYQSPPDLTAVRWDPAQREYVAIPAPATVNVSTISKLAFLRDRLGLQVLASALALEAQDSHIAAFRMMIDNASEIDLSDPVTMAGVNHLLTAGIITQADVARILAPESVP